MKNGILYQQFPSALDNLLWQADLIVSHLENASNEQERKSILETESLNTNFYIIVEAVLSDFGENSSIVPITQEELTYLRSLKDISENKWIFTILSFLFTKEYFEDSIGLQNEVYQTLHSYYVLTDNRIVPYIKNIQKKYKRLTSWRQLIEYTPDPKVKLQIVNISIHIVEVLDFPIDFETREKIKFILSLSQKVNIVTKKEYDLFKSFLEADELDDVSIHWIKDYSHNLLYQNLIYGSYDEDTQTLWQIAKKLLRYFIASPNIRTVILDYCSGKGVEIKSL